MFGHLGQAGKYLGQAARMLVGVPDYDQYVEHMRTQHPDTPAMSYEEFFRERQEPAMAETARAASAAAKRQERSMNHPIPATILTGFLGAGKTTLLRHILTAPRGEQIAVIENEFGVVAIDDRLLEEGATRVTTLSNGCICCTSANELAEALRALLQGLDAGTLAFDRVIIECTGMADPGPIIQTFFADPLQAERFRLDGVITLVDAVHAEQQLDTYRLAQTQVGFVDRLLLTKTDVAGDSEHLIARLQRINARAPVSVVIQGQIDVRELFTLEGFMLNDRLPVARPRFWPRPLPACGVSSVVIILTAPPVFDALSAVMERLLEQYADRLLRYKGILAVEGEARRLLFQGVQRLV